MPDELTMPTEELRALHRRREALAELMWPLEFRFTDREGHPVGLEPGHPMAAYVTGPSDTSYLSASDLANPEIAANVRAMTEVNAMVWWFGATSMGWVGLWLGPGGRAPEGAPVVLLDTEGQYSIVACTVGDHLAIEAAGFGEIDFTAARTMLADAGLRVAEDEDAAWAATDALDLPDDPDTERDERYERYR